MHVDDFHYPVRIGLSGCNPEIDRDRAGEAYRIGEYVALVD